MHAPEGGKNEQIAMRRSDEEIEIVTGSPDENSFVALYHRDGLLRAALGVSRPKQLMPFRKLLAERATWQQAQDLVATFGD